MANTIFGNFKSKKQKDKEKKDAITPVSFVLAILYKDPEDIEAVTPYIMTSKYPQLVINQFFAQKPYISSISEINQIKLTNDQHFDMLMELIPKKNVWKKDGKEIKFCLKHHYKKPIRDVETLALIDKFECNAYLAQQYLKIIDKDELDEIVKKYKLFIKMTKKKK